MFFQDRLTRAVKKGNKKINRKNKKLKGKTKDSVVLDSFRKTKRKRMNHRKGRCHLHDGYVEYRGCKKFTCVKQYKWSHQRGAYIKKKYWVELPA